MLSLDEFRKFGHQLVDWMADYYADIENYTVQSKVKPGDIYRRLPSVPPSESESMDKILEDFIQIIMPGISHWQHPNWHAYFTANASYPSVLAEMLTATLGAQCMSWITSPAATELEEKMMDWLRIMIGLPENFTGVIQDTASTSTLISLITAREVASNFETNKSGLFYKEKWAVYCSTEAHSSIEKAVKIAGLGKENLFKVPVDKNFAMIPEELEKMIVQNIRNNIQPLAVIVALGTTGSTAIDPLKPIGKIAKKFGLWVHVDAAWAGSALILPEKRYMIEGIENVDSFVFNPHKWMFTNFDCSAYFVRNKEALIKTFEILPEYLKTPSTPHVNNYRDWGIQLGRRFRALKLWFVIRNFGLRGLQEKIRNHITWAEMFANWVQQHPLFEIMAPYPLATVCFRLKPPAITSETFLDTLNEELLQRINHTGRLFMTHTRLNNHFTLRMVIGQTQTQLHHVEKAWEIIRETTNELMKKYNL